MAILPLELFTAADSPYRVFAETGDATALLVWADWLNEHPVYAIVPGVPEVLDCIRSAASSTVAAEVEARGVHALAAAPFLLQYAPGDWHLGSDGFGTSIFCKYRSTNRVVVQFENGLPAAVSAPTPWFQIFKHGGRLEELLRRYPRLSAYPSTLPAGRSTGQPPDRAWGYRIDRYSYMGYEEMSSPMTLLHAGIVPRCITVEGDWWRTEHEVRSAVGVGLCKYVLDRIAGYADREHRRERKGNRR